MGKVSITDKVSKAGHHNFYASLPTKEAIHLCLEHKQKLDLEVTEDLNILLKIRPEDRPNPAAYTKIIDEMLKKKKEEALQREEKINNSNTRKSKKTGKIKTSRKIELAREIKNIEDHIDHMGKHMVLCKSIMKKDRTLLKLKKKELELEGGSNEPN